MSLSYILAFKKNCLIYLFQALIIRETFKKYIYILVTKAVNLVQLWHKPCGRWQSRQVIKQTQKTHNPPPNHEIIHQ